MKESAVSLVDVPVGSTTQFSVPVVSFDMEQQRLEVEFPAQSTDELDDTFDEIADLLGIDAPEALRVQLSGSGVSASAVQAVLRFIAQDCDRPIQAVALAADSRKTLLREAVGRDFEPLASVGVQYEPPPVRSPALLVTPVEAEAETETGAETEAAAMDAPAVVTVEANDSVEALDVEVEAEAEAEAEPEPEAEAGTAEAVEAAEGTTDDSAAALEIEAATEAEAGPVAEATEALKAEDASLEVDETNAPSSVEQPTEQIVLESFLDDVESDHRRPWGSTEDGDRRVLALRRTIRSGKIVRFAGDVVVFGDINPGAQVVADGDIVVLGRLRGLAHAGSRGDADAIVVGLDMQSGQVRIGDVIAFPKVADPPSSTSRLGALLKRTASLPTRSVSPAIARLVDGHIRIEDYHGRLHA